MVSAPAKRLLEAVECSQPAAPVAARSSLPDTAQAADTARTVVAEPAQAGSSENKSTILVIRKRPDFLAANRGKRFVSSGFVLLAFKRRDDHPVAKNTIRYGITVTKKIGNAVARNRMKRRFRALLAEILPKYGIAGVDHIMIGRKQNIEPEFAIMKTELEKGLKHLGKKL